MKQAPQDRPAHKAPTNAAQRFMRTAMSREIREIARAGRISTDAEIRFTLRNLISSTPMCDATVLLRQECWVILNALANPDIYLSSPDTSSAEFCYVCGENAQRTWHPQWHLDAPAFHLCKNHYTRASRARITRVMACYISSLLHNERHPHRVALNSRIAARFSPIDELFRMPPTLSDIVMEYPDDWHLWTPERTWPLWGHLFVDAAMLDLFPENTSVPSATHRDRINAARTQTKAVNRLSESERAAMALTYWLAERHYKKTIRSLRQDRGRLGGRPRDKDAHLVARAREIIEQGISLRTAANMVGLSPPTLCRRLKIDSMKSIIGGG